MRLKLLTLLIVCMSQFSCGALQPKEVIVYKDVPEDSVVIKKNSLQKLMGDCIDCKRELIDCLESKKVK